MHNTSSALAVVVMLLLLMIIDAVGWERLPKCTQSVLEKVGRKLLRWQKENPIVSLEFAPAPEENHRRDAILDWLGQPEANLRNGG